MNITELLLLSIGLAMDAFAVSVCKGLAMKKIRVSDAVTVGVWFGVFQALMPLAGYFLGIRFQKYIEAYDHWVAFVLLLIIGANMIRESFSKDEEKTDCSVSPKSMIIPAVATSIDALAVGIALAMVSTTGKIGILPSVAIIGIITFILSMAGVKIGSVFGAKYKLAAERAGGVILILIGVKIVLEHLGIIQF